MPLCRSASFAVSHEFEHVFVTGGGEREVLIAHIAAEDRPLPAAIATGQWHEWGRGGPSGTVWLSSVESLADGRFRATAEPGEPGPATYAVSVSVEDLFVTTEG